MQDLLGEVHDLDVLWATTLSCHVFHDEASRKEWHSRIIEERTKRIDEYRERTTGSDSLWSTWRAGLPQDKQIKEIATRRMKLWAKALDPDFAHSERVARLALELYDGLVAAGLQSDEAVRSLPSSQNGAGNDTRDSLYVAALLHDVGKTKGNKGHHKESLTLITSHGTPLGWKPENMARAALVARFHAGALPTRSHKALRNMLADEQKSVIRLAAILRLANALDAGHDGQVRRITTENVDSMGLQLALRIASHPDVAMVSFTGSTRAGVAVAMAAAPTVKRVTQELGGKSANILLDDADFEKAVPQGVQECFRNAGQSCNAPTRMLVPRSKMAEVVVAARRSAESTKVGDPFVDGISIGPLASKPQFDKVQRLINAGIQEFCCFRFCCEVGAILAL